MSEAFSMIETTRAAGDATHIRIDLHVHLNAPAGGVDPGAAEPPDRTRERAVEHRSARVEGPHRPLLRNLAVVGAVLAVGFIGFRAGGASTQRDAAASVAATAGPAPTPTPSLAESLARELQQPPRVTPPPGAPVNAQARSGLSAFGLHE